MNSKTLLEKAMGLIHEGKAIEAKALLNQIVDDCPDSEESRKALGELKSRYIYQPATRAARTASGLKRTLVIVSVFFAVIFGAGFVIQVLEANKTTPLHEAVRSGNIEDVKNLVDQGADLESRDFWGKAPVHLAVQNDQIDVLKYLLDHGASINARGMRGDSPLQEAVENDSMELVSYLIENGADISQGNEHGDTPLHEAARTGNTAIAEMLVKAGADVNSSGSVGRRPIHNAAAYGHLSTLIFLVENGAGDSLVENNRYSPWRLAIISGHQNIIEYYLDKYEDQWVSQLTDWNKSQHALEQLYDHGWKPKTVSDKIHVYIADRNQVMLQKSWPEARKVLLDDVATLKREPVENALYAFIGIGKHEIIPSLLDILDKKGNTQLAEAYLNSGLKELNTAATKWAEERGYKITPGPGANPVEWGLM